MSDGSDNNIRWRISEVCVILKKDLSLNINYNIDPGEMQKCRAGRWGVGGCCKASYRAEENTFCDYI